MWRTITVRVSNPKIWFNPRWLANDISCEDLCLTKTLRTQFLIHHWENWFIVRNRLFSYNLPEVFQFSKILKILTECKISRVLKVFENNMLDFLITTSYFFSNLYLIQCILWFFTISWAKIFQLIRLTQQIGGQKLDDELYLMFSVSSSGGNAGLAAALACRKMGLPCTVIVPGSTPQVFFKW